MTIAEKLIQIAENEPKVFEAGYEKGKAEGFNAGKQAECDAFWDNYIYKEPMTDNAGLFAGRGWNDKTFKPNKSFTISGSSAYIFYNTGITDLVGLLERLDVTITFSDITGNILTSYSLLTTFPPISFKAALNSSFANSSHLVTIEKVILKEDGSNTFIAAFDKCSALTNLTIEGIIGQNGLNLQWSTKLSRASIESIMTHLDMNTYVDGRFLTLSQAAVDKAFEETEGANDGSNSYDWITLTANAYNLGGWETVLV